MTKDYLPKSGGTKRTHGDLVRGMTDAELAAFLPGTSWGWNCPPGKAGGCPGECEGCWLAWLEEEA